MYFVGIFAIIAVIGVLYAIVMYPGCKEDADRMANGLPPIHGKYTHDNDTRTVYVEKSRPSFYEHCKAGQRPFGGDSRTRRTERERTRTDKLYW